MVQLKILTSVFSYLLSFVIIHGISTDNLLLSTTAAFCYNLLCFTVLLKCRIFCCCETVCVRSGVVNPPAVSVSASFFFVNGDLLCYDRRMDEWEGATGR